MILWLELLGELCLSFVGFGEMLKVLYCFVFCVEMI